MRQRLSLSPEYVSHASQTNLREVLAMEKEQKITHHDEEPKLAGNVVYVVWAKETA